LADDINLGKIIGSSAESFHKIAFGGVVGRLAWVAVAAVAGIAYAAAHTTPSGALIAILAILVVVLVMTGVVVYVVKTKPELSILDGGHVLHYKQLNVGTKYLVPSGELPPVPDPSISDRTIEGSREIDPHE
jgi:hypothetical protein